MDDNKEKDVYSIDEATKIGGRIVMIIAVWFILIGKLFFPAEMNLMQEKAEEVRSELVDNVAIFIGGFRHAVCGNAVSGTVSCGSHRLLWCSALSFDKSQGTLWLDCLRSYDYSRCCR